MNSMIIITAGIIIPVLAFVYAMIRKPAWHAEMTHPNWTRMNIYASLIGIACGGAAAAYQILTPAAANINIWFEAYVAECFSVIGYCTVSCTLTDWNTTKIDRHMMRPLYIIQLALGIAYCLASMNGALVFALVEAILTIFCLLIPYLAIPHKKKDKSGKFIMRKNEKTGKNEPEREYRKLIPMGASDSRALAVMIGTAFPLFTYAIIWPIIGFILIGFGITVWFFAYSGTNVKYGRNGEVKMTEETTFGAQRILAEHTDSMRKQRIPLGPAITIPFFITMFLWLFI